MDIVKNLISDSNADLGAGALKGSLGMTASFAAMSINDWAGLVVAILTGIYMLLQIEAAWHKRKQARKRLRELADE